MASLWDSLRDAVVDTGSRLGSAAGSAAIRAKLKTDLLLIDRELAARKQKFGVEMYDYVAPLSKNPDFYVSDDTLTLTLQAPLITAQREISALELKRSKQQDLINQAAQVRASAFRPAETWTDKLANVGKSAALGGNEAKLSTEMSVYNTQIQHFKQEFGLQLYTTLEDLEDTKQWLPTDREIRSIYDNSRRDIEKIQKRRQSKEKEIEAVQNGGVEAYAGPEETPTLSIQTVGPQPSVYAKQQQQVQTTGQPSSMYPAVQQQREPAPSIMPPHQQPSVRQHHMPTPQMPAPQHPPQQQLHSNLFAGMVPGAAPLQTHQQQQPAVGPFAVFATQSAGVQHAPPQSQQQQQQAPPHFQQPHFQQQQQHNDPFANQFTPPPMLQAPAPAAPKGGYVDPFSGL